MWKKCRFDFQTCLHSNKDYSKTVKDISSKKIRQLENTISQNRPVQKLVRLPQGGHEKIREKMCKTFARHCTCQSIIPLTKLKKICWKLTLSSEAWSCCESTREFVIVVELSFVLVRESNNCLFSRMLPVALANSWNTFITIVKYIAAWKKAINSWGLKLYTAF